VSDLIKEVEQERDNLRRREEQLEALRGDIRAQEAALEAARREVEQKKVRQSQ
jgi:DNA repair exonuclease SbcCD ATPase subunit